MNKIIAQATTDFTILKSEAEDYNVAINKEDLIDLCKQLNVRNTYNLKNTVYNYVYSCIEDLIELNYDLNDNEEYEIDNVSIFNLDAIVEELTSYFEFDVKGCCKAAPEYANYCPICGEKLK